METTQIDCDKIVALLHQLYNSLPSKYKPRRTDDAGKSEWTILSGVVIEIGSNQYRCISLGLGMKCLPASKVATAKGCILHDWHAEVIALRAFNYHLLNECRRLASDPAYVSEILDHNPPQAVQETASSRHRPYMVRSNVKIFLYCSEAPCGDASIELVMNRQSDPTPWPISHSVTQAPLQMLGHESFSQLGVVRRKPARADSPATLSKSCSDKLAIKQVISILSGPLSVLVAPENAYLHYLILPQDQYSRIACDRAFGAQGRMMSVQGARSHCAAYRFQPFQVLTTGLDFEYSRDCAMKIATSCKTSNLAAFWTRDCQEMLINGVRQGWKQNDPRAASQISRLKMMQMCTPILGNRLGVEDQEEGTISYQSFKRLVLLRQRYLFKQYAIDRALDGWQRNVEDDFVCAIPH